MQADARAAAMRAASICLQSSGVLVGSILNIKSFTEPSLSPIMLNPRYNVVIVEALKYIESDFKCFQFFIFCIDFAMTSEPFGPKTFRRMSRIRGNSFPENTFDRFGHINTNVSVKTFCRMSQIRGNSFPENTFDRNRHCCTKISGFWTQNILLDVPFWANHFLEKHVCPKSALLQGILFK